MQEEAPGMVFCITMVGQFSELETFVRTKLKEYDLSRSGKVRS